MSFIPEGVGRGAHHSTVGEPCFSTNGPARSEGYHGLTENQRETTLALCFVCPWAAAIAYHQVIRLLVYPACFIKKKLPPDMSILLIFVSEDR
uniref:SFRICE_037953 n=1 Tax=Spodoptera frugiperda TaxID=7108 RepID=A0A2H1X1K2_SPOFR